jgi:Mg2+/Co2+ transporter CorB
MLSGFFSSSETALMTLNRYRLRHLAEQGHRSAKLAEELLKRPDRLIGLILLGNNLVNILAAQLVTLIALELYGNKAIAIAGGIFTLVILIFAEVTPKTLAALNAERIAFPAAWVYWLLQKPLLPFVWIINVISNNLLRLIGTKPDESSLQALSREELRTVVTEAGAMAPTKYQSMLINVLDLNKITVEDIMVPRGEIVGLDLDDDIDTLLRQINSSQHTRLLVYKETLDDVVGIIHLRRLISAAQQDSLNHDTIRELARHPLFVPEGTPLNRQLVEFQKHKRRIGLVVDEYGDLQGLITLEDILEEVVGEFTTDPVATTENDIFPQEDGTWLIDGSAHIRDVNKAMYWELPQDGEARTMSGMVVEYLENIPEPGTSVKISGYPIEIIQVQDNRIVTLRVGARKDAKADH